MSDIGPICWANIDSTKTNCPCNSNIVYIGPILLRAVDDSWASDIWPFLASRATMGESVFGLAQHWTNVQYGWDIGFGTGCKLMSTQCWATMKFRCRSDVIQTKNASWDVKRFQSLNYYSRSTGTDNSWYSTSIDYDTNNM